MKVYMIDSYRRRGYDFSSERSIIEEAGHELILKECHNDDDIVRECPDADAILNIYTSMGKKSIDALDRCKVLVRYGIGYDNFDVRAATEKGIMVCNIPHYCIPEVAIHATALILGATRNLLNYTYNMREAKYNGGSGSFYQMRRPSTQKVGLVGFGNISSTVAGYVKAMGYGVLAYDPYLDDSVFEKAGVERADFDTVLSESDIISIHVPYSKETHHILDSAAFNKMKDGVIIVNTARGPLIEEAALVEALKSRKVGAAGIDVFEEEPFRPEDHPFYHMNNVILSPHAAYNSAESVVELNKQVAMTAVAVLNGEVPYNAVNKKDLGL